MNTSSQNKPDSASRETFDQWYQDIPPWEIGRPQKEFIRLEKEGAFSGEILDVGCGTGENALFLSSKGYKVVGIDFSPTAIKKAQEKGSARRLTAQFQVLDAFKLTDLKQTFDSVIDSGLFHCFSDEQRPVFVSQLSNILRVGGVYYFLCFSEKETRDGGPRRISKDDIQTNFGKGWSILSIRDAKFENTLHEGDSLAYLVSIQKQE